MPEFIIPTGPLPTDPDDIVAEYASLLSYYNQQAPSRRSFMPAPTAAAAATTNTAYTPRFATAPLYYPQAASSTAMPANPAGQGIDTATSSNPINPSTRQYVTTTSTSLYLFLTVLLFVIYVFFHHESARMQRLLAVKRRGEEMRYWTRYGAAREEERREEEGKKWEEGREREEMEEKVEEAARVMRKEMAARLGVSVGEDGLGLGMGMEIKVDDRWRYRMRAEDRDRELRRRGIPVVVEDGQEMEVDEPVRVYEVQPQEQVQGFEKALTASVEWMRMVVRIVSFELKILTKGALKIAGLAGAVWLAYRVVRYFMKEDYQREGDRVDWFLQVGLHFICAIFGTLILPILIFAAFWTFVVGLDNTVQ
ncbi:MAG: hypothetical protein Q9184_006999, partial [Pyrenodesmia sp. 2 TL-2023]